MVFCHTQASRRIAELTLAGLRNQLPRLRRQPATVLIKPNWVLHEADPAFPIRALVTDARLIDATIAACLELFPAARSILVADCPLQSANWPLMCRQSGLDQVIAKYAANSRVTFRDFRKHAYRIDEAGGDTFLEESPDEHGDPRGYREVELGARSHLETISDQSHKFAVNDYSASVTRSNHRQGSHCYLVSQSILDAELVINLPKWKSHQKSGITGALKNLVGINGDKAYLPHFRRGAPKWGGDEYRDENRWLYWAQTTLRERFQKRSRFAYRLLKPGWEFLKRVRGIETRMTTATATSASRYYIAGGSWWGNDTLWRMIYDLNLIIRHVDAAGRLHDQAQRDYFCIVDGLISGEGNGPLQPLPRDTDWLVFGEDPFAIDAALTWFMGFDSNKIPVIERRKQFAGSDWGRFSLEELEVDMDGDPQALVNSPINFHFAPPPGWRDHIER